MLSPVNRDCPVFDVQNGNQDRQTLPDGETESAAYNANSQIVSSTDFDGNTAGYTYFTSGPHAGLLSQVVYAGAPGSGKATQTVNYGYDGLNRKQTVTDASGTTTDSYDDFGNLDEEQTPEGTISYAFDPATGNLDEAYTADTATYYGYDLQGRLNKTKVTTLNGQSLGTALITRYTYDPAGNELTASDPNGEVTTNTYDDLNRLKTETIANGGTTLFSQSLVLNHDGTRASSSVSQLQPGGSTVTTSTTWTYDALQRLTQEAYTSSAPNENYTDVFTYDLASNRMSSAHTGPGGGANETVTYGYNGDDELTSQTSSLSGTTTKSYDPNGSLTTSTAGGVTTTYTYDARNKMVGYSSGSMVAAYVYDDAGNRVQETVNGVTTYYLTDTQNPTGYAQPVEQKASPTAAPSITYFLGSRVFAQADASGNVTYLLADGHGSTQQLANAGGTVTAAFRYTAFGAALNFAPAGSGTVFLFGGDAVYDPSSGLYLHGDGVRATNGFLFVQRDTYAGDNQDPLSLHKYLYANGDPTNGGDPSGRFIVADDEVELEKAHADLEAGKSAAEEIKSFQGFADEENALANAMQSNGPNVLIYALTAVVTGSLLFYAPAPAPTPVAAPGTAPSPAPPPPKTDDKDLPPDALVVRGGLCLPDSFTNGTGVTTDANGILSDVSVNSMRGVNLVILCSTLKNNRVGVSTVGQVEAAGGYVIPWPTANNPFHCKLGGITAITASSLFTPTIPNPAKVP